MNSKKSIDDVLSENGIFVSTTVGLSMYPMLRNRRDTIMIERYEGRLNKYDVPLYKSGTRYVLHRIIEVRPDSYVIRGDNCYVNEYGITDEQILGVLTGFYRGTKKVDMQGWQYKLYVRFWVAIYPMRKLYFLARRKAGQIWHRLRKGEEKA